MAFPVAISISISLFTCDYYVFQTKRGKEEEYLKEQACLWNSKTGSNEIILDEDKETEIKRVMSRIRLPNTAIPSWAKEISDDEWKSQILSVFGSNLSEKN